MSEIKKQLREIVEGRMIPECEAYLEDLHKLIDGKEAEADDMEAIKEMESFLVELQNILEALNQNELNDEDAQVIYNKIIELLSAHDEDVENME